MSYRNILEGYALEVAARAESCRKRCEQLAAADFVSKAPKNLVKTLQNIFEYLAQAIPGITSSIDWSANQSEIDTDKSVTVLRVLDFELKRFAAHIRYVDSAVTDRLPWQVIPSFEKLVLDIRPEAQVMLRPMWHYNYATIVSNLRELYRKRLQEFEFYLPNIDLDIILEPLGSAFHIVSFPAVERQNILLHSLIGHEIGHLIANALVDADQQEFLNKVRPEIEATADSEITKLGVTPKLIGPLVYPTFRAQWLADKLDLCLQYWIRALEEILSDLVGVALFGPAALFSTLEFAIQTGFDLPPTRRNNYYPPWRTRIREVLRAVDNLAPELLQIEPSVFKMDFPLILKRIQGSLLLSSDSRARLVNDRVRTIREISQSNQDKTVIDRDRIAKIAYSALPDYITKHSESIKNKVGNNAFSNQSLAASLPALIERLDAGITPNAIHDKPSRRAPKIRLVDVLNSAWYHKASLSVSAPKLEDLSELERLRDERNRLTLKSIEYVSLYNEYPRARRRKSKARSDEPTGTGVLTSEDLQEWMEKDSILERLIITPLFDPAQSIGDSAIDVRLGTEFVLFRKETFQSLDITSDSLVSKISNYQHRVVRPIREPFVLHPRQLVIGSTLEYVSVPPGLLAYVIGKSTWGRTGLIIATATKVDPGFRGSITLEIVNEGEVPLVLVPGIPIAQLVFHRTESLVSYDGMYSSPIGPEFPRFDKLVESSAHWLTSPRGSKRRKR
ncbi:MAG TPA: dCTP deaminase [Pyrinomonadaceae bacterium]|nr:dCTP deaminase [Pyrinomonadaceae bacterium]